MKLAPIALLAAALVTAGATNAATVSDHTNLLHEANASSFSGKFQATSTFIPPSAGTFANKGTLYRVGSSLIPKTLLGYWPMTVNSPGDIKVTAVNATGGNAADIGTDPTNGTITLSTEPPQNQGATANMTAIQGTIKQDKFYIGLYNMKSMTTSAEPTNVSVIVTSYDS